MRDVIKKFKPSNLFVQSIALFTALAAFFLINEHFVFQVGISIFVWWGWLVIAKVSPAMPDFLSERQLVLDLWKGRWRLPALVLMVVYFPIFASKTFYFYASILLAVIYFIFVKRG